MKKLFLLATVAMLMCNAVAFANDGGKDKKKARTEKKCPKPCPPCCDKNKCEKS